MIKKEDQRFVFRKLVGKRGLSATVHFDVLFDETSKNNSMEVVYSADDQWKSSCLFALEVFYREFKKDNLGLLKVTIQRIDWLPVDTTIGTVFYTTIKAMEHTLGFKLSKELVNFDENRIQFSIW